MFSGSVAKRDSHSAFVAEVKRSLPPEKSVEFFQTISSYRKTDNYENLAVKVAGLFKDNLSLLVSKFPSHVLHLEYFHMGSFLIIPLSLLPDEGCGLIVRPHHQKQYKQMLDGLVGQDQTVCQDQERKGPFINPNDDSTPPFTC